jgi:hypothetical protein
MNGVAITRFILEWSLMGKSGTKKREKSTHVQSQTARFSTIHGEERPLFDEIHTGGSPK